MVFCQKSAALGNALKRLPSYTWRKRINGKQPTLSYTRSLEEADSLLNLVRAVDGPLGLDIEWKPNFEKGKPENKTALIQLASASKIWLIQTSAMPQFPQTLRYILENPDIAKVGVGIRGDAVKLWRDFSVSLRHCIDVAYMAQAVDPASWANNPDLSKTTSPSNDTLPSPSPPRKPQNSFEPIGLARLVQTYTLSDLSKTPKIRRSNWELALSEQQQDYAANDAQASLRVYFELLSNISKSNQSFPPAVAPRTGSYYKFNYVDGNVVPIEI